MEKQYCVFCMHPVEGEVCDRCGKSGDSCRPAPHHLRPGTILNEKYLVGSVLGEGGFGITYIGRDLNLDLRVAIKEYYPSGIANRNHLSSDSVEANVGDDSVTFEKGRESFLKEARALAKFAGDAGIVSVRDFFTVNNTAYIVMEYLEGTELRVYAGERGKLTFEEAYELLAPVMSSLERIHEAGLIHRDISPANIMIQKNGSAKLLDFGAARDIREGDKSLSVLLKPGFAPEEQYRTKGNQGPWTDVYAIAATMYRVITGVTPDDSMDRLYQDEVKMPSKWNDTVTEAQDQVIMKGMGVRQDSRYPSVAAFQAACVESLRGGTGTRDDEEKTMMGMPDTNRRIRRTTESGFREPPSRSVSRKETTGKQTEAPKTESERETSQRDIPTPKPIKPVVKKPSVLAFVGSLVTGAAALVFLFSIFAQLGNPPVNLWGEIIHMVLFGGLSAFLGSFYYPRAAKQERKPNVFCFVMQLLTALVTLISLISMAADFGAGYNREGFERLGVACVFGIMSLFFAWFYYLRLFWKNRRKALIVWSLILALTLTGLGIYLGSVALSTVTIAGTRVERDATRLDLYSVEIPDADMQKLTQLKALEELSLYDCMLDNGDVKILGQLTQLRELDLEANPQITDVQPLSLLTGLEELLLSQTGVTDISALRTLTQLESLELSGTPVSDLSVLGDMSSLADLEINDMTQLNSASLRVPQSLTRLNCQGSGLTDLSWLKDATGLTDLYVSDNAIRSLSGLEGLSELRAFYISNNQISDLTALRLDNLNYLKADGNVISDITCLAAGVNLYALNLANNQITDISPLSHCINLEELNLSGNGVSDIYPLRDCLEITELQLDGNRIQDISVLPWIVELENVSLAENELMDISPLALCEKLVANALVLDLHGNQITSLEALSAFSKLESLNISGNQITSLSGLDDFEYLEELYADDNLIVDLSPLQRIYTLGVLSLNFNQIMDVNPLLYLPNISNLGLVGNSVADVAMLQLVRSGIRYASLDVSYHEEIDWDRLLYLAESGDAIVTIYDADARQQKELEEMGFWHFGNSAELKGANP